MNINEISLFLKSNKVSSFLRAGAVLLLLTPTFFTCKDPEGLYREYLVPGGLQYPAKIMDAEAHPGDNRIEITWRNGVNPSVTKARIFWNNYADSAEVAIDKDVDFVSKELKPMEENIYSFMIHTYDAAGNASMPVEVIGEVYGDAYISSLSNRILKDAVYDPDETNLKLEWYGAVNKTETGVEISYTGLDNAVRSIFMPPSKTDTTLSDFKVSESLFYKTAYKPDTMAIDLFYAPDVEMNFDILVTGVTLDKYSIDIPAGVGAVTLTASVEPANAINKDVTWSWVSVPAGNTTMVELTPGEGGTVSIRAYSVGQAKVIATSNNGVEASCTVNVTAPEFPLDITGYVLNNTQFPFDHGASVHASLSLGWYVINEWEANAEAKRNGNVLWSSSSNYVLIMWAGDLLPTATMTNGKLYQTVMLGIGKYKFEADVSANTAAASPAYTSYLVANIGSDLPDVSDIETALSKSASVDYNASRAIISIEFTLSSVENVSLGFLTNVPAGHLLDGIIVYNVKLTQLE